MKKILEQWSGKFKIGNEISINLDNFNPKDGEEFEIELLSKRREINEDDDILSTY